MHPTPTDTMDRLVRMRERGALNPETEASVQDYLRRRSAVLAGQADPGPMSSPNCGPSSPDTSRTVTPRGPTSRP